MGKDNDIIDSMFNGLIQLVGWIFKQIFNLLGWIIKGLFNLIAGAISKNKNRPDNSQSSDIDLSAVNQLYIDTENFINNLYINNCSSESDLMGKTREIVSLFANQIVTNGVLSVNQKCELLTLLNEKLQQDATSGFSNMVFVKIIEYSYKVIEGVVPSPLLLQKYDTFKQELAQNNVRNFTTYFGEIFSASGLLGSPNGKFNMDYSIFDNYNVPKYREI